jgi:hypothetical protein
MLPESPLEIPEITRLVASYLDGKDLARCVQVSKKWRHLFLFHRWRVVRVGSKHPSTRSGSSHCRIGPHPSGIYHHRHLIQELSLFGDTAGLEKYNYPILGKLTVDYQIGAEDPEREVFLELTDMFPSLIYLAVLRIKLTPPSWSALSAHPRIMCLSLCNMEIKVTDAPQFWEVCKKLEGLTLTDVAIRGGTISTGVVFNRLNILEITTHHGEVANTQDQLDLILRCPSLVHMFWCDSRTIGADKHPNINTNCIPKGWWPHLQRLHITLNLRSTEMASILEGIGDEHGKLTHLELNGCFLKNQGSRALRSHFATLVKLDLADCRYVSSRIFRDVLCSCPNLEILCAKGVLARDLVAGGPWVCHRLRKLSICFLFGESEQDLQQEIFGRLSTLSRLVQLTMHTPKHQSYEEEGRLEFRLENGLDQLASLQQLTSLSFDKENGPHIPQLGKDEVVWMLANWKKLTIISGKLNDDPREDQRLKDALQLLGVKVKSGLSQHGT